MKKIFTLFIVFAFSSAFAQEEVNSSVNDSILKVNLEEVMVTSGVIDVAKERETPIALTTIRSQEIEAKLGNQEFVNIMQNSPGIYVNNEKGGYGDGQIYVRGFNQVNTSFLINGVPVNDMENGRVYWSNWMVLTDMTNQIQMQRGLGSSSLAVPSVGGTVSIFTKSSEIPEGGVLRQTIGNDGYSKTTFGYNTGVNENGWSSSYLVAYWKGDGYVMGTEGEGWNYAATIGYTPSDQHKFNLTLVGAVNGITKEMLTSQLEIIFILEQMELIDVGIVTTGHLTERLLISKEIFIINQLVHLTGIGKYPKKYH